MDAVTLTTSSPINLFACRWVTELVSVTHHPFHLIYKFSQLTLFIQLHLATQTRLCYIDLILPKTFLTVFDREQKGSYVHSS